MRRKQRNGQRAPGGVLHQFVGEAIGELRPARGARRSARPTSAPRSQLIAGAPQIHVLAQRRAFPVACYLAYALSQLELRDAPARRRRRHAARDPARGIAP